MGSVGTWKNGKTFKSQIILTNLWSTQKYIKQIFRKFILIYKWVRVLKIIKKSHRTKNWLSFNWEFVSYRIRSSKFKKNKIIKDFAKNDLDPPLSKFKKRILIYLAEKLIKLFFKNFYSSWNKLTGFFLRRHNFVQKLGPRGLEVSA